jgi:hypothetical protein
MSLVLGVEFWYLLPRREMAQYTRRRQTFNAPQLTLRSLLYGTWRFKAEMLIEKLVKNTVYIIEGRWDVRYFSSICTAARYGAGPSTG